MRILFGIPRKVHNGIAIAEVEAFKKLGDNVEISDYGNSGEESGLVKSLILVFKNAINLKRKSKNQKSEIVYLNTAFDNKTIFRDSITIFILRTFNKKIKIVFKIHGSIKSVVLSKRNILKWYLFNKVSLFLVLSKEELNTFLETGINQDKVKVTANAIDSTQYIPDSRFRKTYEIESDKIILLFVGRFIEEKGIIDVINACKLLQENSVRFELFCLGDGPLFEKVKSQIEYLKLENNIKLLGHIPEEKTRPFYSNCDILILPTFHAEGFPMAIFQAVASGMSIITTKIRASADYLKEYENCLWVKRNSPTDIYDKILILEKDKELREKIGKNNLCLSDRFTADNIVGNLNIYLRNF